MPKYPKKTLAQLVLQQCARHKIEHVVISPGSRNAPLTIGFVEHPAFRALQVVDERSAGFFALGIAQQTRKPVALLCTSGSALLNYYPAVAEAYYSKVPLVVLSADRPGHLIDIGDGQTIRQEGVFHNHILFEGNLKESLEETHDPELSETMLANAVKIDKAISTAGDELGPVHLNIPFEEPLYETVDSLYDLEPLLNMDSDSEVEPDTLLDEEPLDVDLLQGYADIWNQASRKLVLIGVNPPDALIQKQMEHLAKDPSVLILTETTSNVHDERSINAIDQLVFSMDEENFAQFQPEVLLTFGGMVVSKRIKQILRKYPPREHWHIDPHRAMDTYFCLTEHFAISPQLFFSQFFFLTRVRQSEYQASWLAERDLRRRRHREFLQNAEYADLKVFEKVLSALPKGCSLQLGNSSVIRYSQLFELEPSVQVFCNRGTSGIDGSTSTAVGAAFANERQTVLITGDVSFFYDSNGLWNKYIRDNFRIVLINNHGGGIFRFLPGPADSGALEFFESPHGLSARALCDMHGLSYRLAGPDSDMEAELRDFFGPSEAACLLEIQTPSETNDRVLRAYFEFLRYNEKGS